MLCLTKTGVPRAVAAFAAATCILVATGALHAAARQPGAANGRAEASLSVRSYGAKGDGKADDTRAFIKALQAASRSHRRLVVPAGVYRLRPLRVPDGLRLKGAGRGVTWLKGHLTFGSDQRITDLKIGEAGDSAVHNSHGAKNTIFERCRFRGGGGPAGQIGSSVIALGMNASCSNITFINCEVERCLGADPDFANGYNDITVHEGKNARVSAITFDGCHVGVSNGVATGSPRMGIECWVNPDTNVGWQNITIRNCVFEATDAQCLDFADRSTAVANGVLVEGCTLKGAGVTGVMWGYTICLECPTGVVIRNNTIYRSSEIPFKICNIHPGSGPAAIVTGNNFDFASDNGIALRTWNPILLKGIGNQFTGNTVSWNSAQGGADAMIELDHATNNAVTGNTFNIGAEPIYVEGAGCLGNIIANNTVM